MPVAAENRNSTYSKTCLKRPLKKKTKIGFQDRLSLNADQKYCRMLQGEHSAILSIFIKLPFAMKTFVLSLLCGPLRQVLLYYDKGLITGKPDFVVWKQQGCRPACASMQTNQYLCYLLPAKNNSLSCYIHNFHILVTYC